MFPRSSNPPQGVFGHRCSPAGGACGAHNGFVKVLLVEDDDDIAEPLVTGLEREGFDVCRAASGGEALRAAPVDIVLLDLRLPDLDGYEVCRQLRSRSSVPIIMVTARGEEVDRVVGLELGADDYLVKPFGFRELVARIRAVTRRTADRSDPTAAPTAAPPTGAPTAAEPAAPPAYPAVLQAGALTLDRRSRRVLLAGREIQLTPREFDLLALLMEQPGAALARQRILEEAWDTHWFGATKTLDVHVSALRRKLGDPAWIETVRGVGFRLNAAGPR